MAPRVDLSKPHVRVWAYAIAVHAALFSISYGPNGTGVLFIAVGLGVIFALVRMYHDGAALILFAGQVFYAYVFGEALGLALSEAYNAKIKSESPLLAADAIIFGIVGLVLGWSTLTIRPFLRATAKWIWIVPVPLFVYGFLHDWLWPCKFCIDAKMLYFIPSGADEGLTTGLVTWPAFSLSGYSLGAWITNRMRVQPRPPALL